MTPSAENNNSIGWAKAIPLTQKLSQPFTDHHYCSISRCGNSAINTWWLDLTQPLSSSSSHKAIGTRPCGFISWSVIWLRLDCCFPSFILIWILTIILEWTGRHPCTYGHIGSSWGFIIFEHRGNSLLNQRQPMLQFWLTLHHQIISNKSHRYPSYHRPYPNKCMHVSWQTLILVIWLTK